MTPFQGNCQRSKLSPKNLDRAKCITQVLVNIIITAGGMFFYVNGDNMCLKTIADI